MDCVTKQDHRIVQSNGRSEPLLERVQHAFDSGAALTAQRVCEERIRVAPDDAGAQRLLSQVLLALNHADQAAGPARRACQLAPHDPRVWSSLGQVYVSQRKFQDALTCFAEAVQIDPHYADGWHNLGTACKQLGQMERAFDSLKRALLIDPTRAETYLTLGNLLVEADQLDDALVCFERAAHHDPSMAKARSRLAQELLQHGRVTQAESVFRQALALDPDHVEGWIGLGRTLEDVSQAEAALGCYLNALKRQPGHGLALGQYLSLVKDDAEAAPWVAHAEQALTRSETPDEAKALVGYGLAKYYDQRGNYREAAHAGLAANAARRRKAGPLDRAALAARVDGIIATYTADFFHERRRFGIGTDQPVFIVGLPRSGTTLTEQILAAHPFMFGAGELPDLARLAVQSLAGRTHAPWQAAAHIQNDMASRLLAHEYLRALRRNAPTDCRRISDKQPLNFFHLAFAALLFPNARVIHCRRDPRDTALSIWMENFNPDQRYATDFDDLAFFTRHYRRAMAHWHEVLPLKILDVQYEQVVADLEGQVKRLIAFLGAPWDDRCLAFHRQERAVQTPSRWQVRQPIYTGSVGRWQRYRDFLPELEAACAGLEED